MPLAVFTLNYFKNLMTLNVFKSGDFENIANLDNKREERSLQNRVRKSAHKNILKSCFDFLSRVWDSVY